MKYVLLVSHGMFAPGLHSALNMLAGGGREDILSASLEDGMELKDLPGMLIPEAREELKEFQITGGDSEDDI